MYIYRCEDSLESIFTAVYRVYEERRPKDEVLLALDQEPRLFAVELTVEADRERSEKVAGTLCRRFGMEDYERVCLALASPNPDKAQAVYRTIVSGLALRESSLRGKLFQNLGEDPVCSAFKLARNADRECCHLKGFLRFKELENGALYARVAPANHLLPFLMAHFADRFPEEAFMIHDVGRNLAGVHTKEDGTTNWILTEVPEIPGDAQIRLSAEEGYYQELFRTFCRKIGIRERENKCLQRNLLPLYFRKYMTEFQNDGSPR